MTVGILCGLQVEAKIADKMPHVLVGCSGVRQDRAQEIVGFLIEKGVNRLISFGLAAGLSPDIEAGDLLLGATVVSNKGAWEADDVWNTRFVECLPCYQCAPIWGSDVLLTTAKDKIGCGIRSGCLAADMESHIVAQAAAQARIPFNIIRAICDPSPMDMPPAALLPLLDDGHVDFRGVFSSLYNKPSQLSELIKLGIYTNKAFSALKNAVSVIAEVGNEEGEGG